MSGSGRYAGREEGVHLVSWQVSLAVPPCGEAGLCQAASALLPDLTRGCHLLVTSAPSLFWLQGHRTHVAVPLYALLLSSLFAF